MKLAQRMTKKQCIIAVTALALFLAWGVWYTLLRDVPDPYNLPGVAADERFKYGSIGSEATRGVPYWVWIVMPELFPQHLPGGGGGWPALGLIWEEGHATPVGFAKKDIGIIPRAGLNCAVCHSVSYRTNPDQAVEHPTVYPGGGSQRFDLHTYQRFLYRAAGDPTFNADTIMPAIEGRTSLSLLEKLLYRYIIIPLSRDTLLDDSKQFAMWKGDKPDPGPGRIDPFNPIKFRRLQQPVDGTIGNADIMSVWNLKLRDNRVLHWDGTNPDATEVIISSAIGDGADPSSMDIPQMTWLESYLRELPPPQYPFPVEHELAAKGAPLFQRHCGECHALDGKRTGQVIPISEVQTDDHRLFMWEHKDAMALNALYEEYDWGFSHYRDTDGYASVPLDGIWLRAPYLHNGSIPSLRALLSKQADRPTRFYRGRDIYDPVNVGFQSDVARDEQTGRDYFLYDVSVAGNDNGGHLYGTDLTADEKTALLEYLKTL